MRLIRFSCQDGIISDALKRAREDAIHADEAVEEDVEEIAHDQFNQYPEVTSTSGTTGRPAIKFIDVGDISSFSKDSVLRDNERARKERVRSKKVPKHLYMVS